MPLTMKDFLFFLGILWVILLFPGTSASLWDPSSEFPFVIYPMNERTNYQKDNITCNNSNKDNTMNLSRGVKCLSDDGATEVTVPLLHKSCRSPAKKLTITVNREDDVVIEFKKHPGWNQMEWHQDQDPKKPYGKINMTDESKLIVPHDKAKESGVYLFKKEDSNAPGGSNKCAVVIIRRECPANRYGDQCSHWCPDCMHGGICDAKTGKCVCPPGFKGEWCEEACEGDQILNSCTINLWVTSNMQICLPPPYGCSCAPGKKGYLCNEDCDPGTWGVNCLQRCNHCVGGTCDKVTGKCSSGREDPCAGGPKGYLRFRQEPDVELDEDKVTVSFVKEFDGEEPKSDDITYRVVIWEKDQSMSYSNAFKEVKDPITQTEMWVTIRGLTPATSYYAAVLVKFPLNGKFCEIDGTLRGERIQKRLFTTKCPKGKISNIIPDWKSQEGFNISWKEAYAKRCNYTYEVKVERVSDGEEIYYKNSMNLYHSQDGLEIYTEYRVSIAVVSERGKSDPSITTIKTLPTKPTTPPSVERIFEDSGSVTYKWNRPSGVEGNISYKYTYEVKPIACGEETENPADKVTEATEVSFPKPLPYARVTFRIAIGNEAGFSGYKEMSHETNPEVPAIKVEKIDCGDYKSRKQCSVTLEKDSRKINGRDLDIEAVWEYKTNSARDPKSGNIQAVYFSAQNMHDYIIELPRDLYHFTTYQLAVYVKNEAGTNESSRYLSEKIITPPVAPGKVKITRIVSSHSSLDSGWDPKLSFPPTGDINGYVIDLGWDPLPSFPPTGNINGYVIEVYETRHREFIGGFVVADESCVISYLDPDVSYTIHVSGINEGVPQPGEAAIIVVSTLAYKPSQPINFLQDSSLSCNAQWDDENIPLSEDLIFQNEDYSISEKEHKEQCD